MAHNIERLVLPFKAASLIGQYKAVRFLAAGSALPETVVESGSFNEDVVGVAIATAAPGQEVGVAILGEIKMTACASLGAGARVAVGSTNGRVVPALLSFGGSTAAVKGTIGFALKNAVDADVVAVLIKPEQII